MRSRQVRQAFGYSAAQVPSSSHRLCSAGLKETQVRQRHRTGTYCEFGSRTSYAPSHEWDAAGRRGCRDNRVESWHAFVDVLSPTQIGMLHLFMQ